jgi:hypothetical protein
MNFLEQNKVCEVIIGPLLDSVDGKTPVEVLEIGEIVAAVYKGSVRTLLNLSAENLIHIADGYWKLSLTAEDTNTDGRLKITLRDDDVFLSVMEDFYVLPAELDADPADYGYFKKLLWLVYRFFNKVEKDASAKKVYVCDDNDNRITEQPYSVVGNNESFEKATQVSE